MRKNLANQTVHAQLTTINGLPFTGQATVYVTGDSAIQYAGAGACAHKGNGAHVYVPLASETNYERMTFTFVATGMLNFGAHFETRNENHEKFFSEDPGTKTVQDLTTPKDLAWSLQD